MNVRSDMRLHEEVQPDDFSGEYDWMAALQVGVVTHVLMYRYMQSYWDIHPKINMAITMSAAVMNMWLWNNIHYSMHSDEKAVPLTHGPPRLVSSRQAEVMFAPLFDVLKNHHWLHHAIKSRKTNFCTIFLGADKVFNTYPQAHELSEVTRQ